MSSDWSRTEGLEYLKDKVKEIKTAMLTTYTEEKGFHSRPMGTADIDDEGNIWFFTNEYSPKVSEISMENTVSLTYSDVKNHTYLSIVATAQVVDDKEKMKELWNPFIQTFFPQGLDDPKLTLLKVIPNDAEYWDSSSSRMVVLFNMLKATLTGKQYDEGKHGKVAL
ncbi:MULTISPECIES: pyridoxamine 5'-phosphate oxidase family protein [unclassified Mucilaginibacter]|uniref:pyridoxamine 5'-phosphate oxidase family protein n=1 Tax=unclassified Mucilaginibacter TaxID=2617802 RepID=UPI00096452FD|nr:MULTISPECIES: pyridoxamine 5'-phosphate oxidase family protein [unclassified Mucilaginibacter]OJW18432.1 MAG: pyridoxamine 5'-phosphate oxidase [Mucilaginibacter sp. 44-25]PLW89362.1 MAG: pyridoxamine 5'-phosphate oxidase [Mucilaginibacter sp.]PMP64671.1 MAG: pyridoxamine 5'-phosphate oxidase [Mucilaginibacter sp.]HEK21262.1 pyridoxamine 5'-phosphate oxidase [Bacteroidota bacterium]